MVGKKGMSPIIATILLIAFAVALGALIMNISTDFIEGGQTQLTCGKIEANMREDPCYNVNQLRLNIQNTGDTSIDGFVISIDNSGISQEIVLKNSKLEKSNVLMKEIPATLPEDEYTLSILPYVQTQDGLEVCGKAVYTTSSIRSCG